ncbi:MAG: hypothetical protein LLG04_09640 [Parachlamydia sp.]|nr:hypothetical protein [Parachlamydia sp.]
MPLISFNTSFPLVKEYLGVKFSKDEPFLKFQDKTNVSSCALNALTGYTKPEMEQEIILDLLIRKLERQDISDPKLMDGLDREEAQFVRKEVDHLLSHIFHKMKDKDLNPEGIRKARHKLALELSRHKTNHFHHSIDIIRDFDSKLAVKNQELAARERAEPIPPESPKAINNAIAQMEGSKTKRIGLSREAMSAFYLNNPVEVSAKPLNLGADVRRHVNYLSAKIGGKILFKDFDPKRDFKNVEGYLKGFFEGLNIPEKAQGSILAAWEACKSTNFDASFDKFHAQLSKGEIQGETGKQLARLFTGMSQIHYLGPGGAQKRLFRASEIEGAKGIAYQFDKDGGIAVKSHCTFHRADCEMKVVNTMKSSAANPSDWTSNVEVIVEVHIGRSDKETRERLRQINAQVVQPLLENGIHVRVVA